MDAQFLVSWVLLANGIFSGSSVLVGILSWLGKKIPGITHHIFYFLLLSGTIFGNVLYGFYGEFSLLLSLQFLVLASLPFFRKGGMVHITFGWFSFFLCIIQIFLFKYHAN